MPGRNLTELTCERCGALFSRYCPPAKPMQRFCSCACAQRSRPPSAKPRAVKHREWRERLDAERRELQTLREEVARLRAQLSTLDTIRDSLSQPDSDQGHR